MDFKVALTEIVLKTREYERLCGFYDLLLDRPHRREMIPSRPADRATDPDFPVRMRFLTLDPMRSFGGDTLAIFECSGAGDADGPTRLHHFQLKFPSLETAFETYRRMKAAGYQPQRAQNHGVSTSLYYVDPDGNRVELNVRNFSSEEEEARYAASEEFTSNPAGWNIDADDILDRSDRGERLQSLVWERT